MKKVLTAFFAVVLLFQVGTILPNGILQEAYGNHQGVIFFPSGQPFATFDANQEIKISGAVEFYISQCSNPDKTKSIPDSTNPIADVYIIRSSSVSPNAPLSDISGVPNVIFGSTIGGAFFDVTIGLTGPAGPIGEGTYSIVFDECQDGDFGVEDFIAPNAFEVKITTTGIPSLPTSFLAAKASAGEKADSALLSCRLINAFLWGKAALGVLGTGGDLLGTQLINLINLGVENLPDGLDAVVSPEAVAANICIQNARTFEGIAADPPDPNFEQFTSLPQREYVSSFSNDPLFISVAELSNSNINEDALASSLLGSLEKYQGAEIEKRGSLALIHSRAITDYSNLLSTQTSASNTFVDNLITQLSTDPTSFDSIFSDLQNLKTRLQNSGLTQEERQEALNLGLSPQQIDEAINVFSQNNFDVTTSSIVSDLEDLKTKNNGFVSDLNSFSVDVQSIITTLENDVLSLDETPNVNPGGPYAGIEGTLVSFDGTASSSNLPIILYEWDLDGDEEFDDATGPNPTFTYDEPFDGYVGLRVTNSIEKSNAGYSEISISDSNRIPAIESFNPLETFPSVEIGNSLTFSISTSDPDGDTVTSQWFVNSILTATGNSFNFQPDPNNLGFILIEVIASDDNPLGGSVEHEWVVNVLDVDNDLDGWRANVDCDETNANVNPGQEEVLGNGLDDDCNSDTPDVGTEPKADFDFFPLLPYIEQTTLFKNRSFDPDGKIEQYHWDFDDGSSSHDINPMYMFRQVRDFAVSLQVTDDDGNTASITKQITIQDNPPANNKPDAFDLPIPPRVELGPGGIGAYGGAMARGDLNNDGFQDLAVADTKDFVDVFLGGPNEFGDNGVVSFRVENGGSLGLIPTSLAIGDVNHDEIDDLIVGLPRSNFAAEINGAVEIYYGSDGAFDDIVDEVFEMDRIQGNSQSRPPRFGSAVAVGDINDDGLNDVIVGASTAKYDPFPDKYFGLSCNFARPASFGEIHIFLGGSAHNIRFTGDPPRERISADIILQKDFIQEGFGPKLFDDSLTDNGCGGGGIGDNFVLADISGDGIDDIITGCAACADIASWSPPSNRNTSQDGKVMVFFGNTDASKIGNISQVTHNLFNRDTDEFEDVTFTLYHYDIMFDEEDFTIFKGADRFGSAIASGDINDDGSPDLIVGAIGGGNPGDPDAEVRIFLGGLGILDNHADTIITHDMQDFMGTSVGSGDFNGDDVDDVIVGTPESIIPRRSNGFAQVFYGSTAPFDTNPDKHLLPTELDGTFGWRVMSMNTDNDAFDEAVVSLPGIRKVNVLTLSTALETLQNTPLAIGLLGEDLDTDPDQQLSYFISQPPLHGTISDITPTGLDTADVTYTPNLGFVGSDRFSLKNHDGIGGSFLANVEILVTHDTVTVDVNPPILTPPPDVIVDATSATGQVVDIGQATVMDDFDPNPDVTNDAPALFQIGETVVIWRATDVSGNSVEATQRVTVQDDTPPQVEIVSPGDGDSFNEGQGVDIQVNAFDNVKVQRVELLVDGIKVDEDSQAPFSFPFVAPILGPSDLSPREITLEARAFDLAEQSASASVGVRVFDVTAPPIPNLVLPPDSSLFFNENPILAWHAVEDPSTPLTYTPRLVNTLNPNDPLDLVSLNPLAAQPPAVLPNGDYQWQVMAADSQGNASPFSSFFTFSIDTLPPPPTRLLLPLDNSVIDNNLPTLEWEDVSGGDTLFYVPRLDKVEDDGLKVEIELVSLSLTSAEPITVLDDGNYEWQVTVLDQAGNTAESSVFSFTVDTLVEAGPTIQDLIDLVDSLVSDEKLDPRIARSLLWLLNAADSAEQENDLTVAISKLNNFNARVDLFERRGLISPEVGASLINLANDVILELDK